MFVSTERKQGPRPKGADPTGIPAGTRARFERLTGCSYADVRVRYQSSQPARIGARAFTRGNQVYIGPGEEDCLPHELAHVFQQKEGRVPAEGVCPALWNSACSDNAALEREADALAREAMDGPAAPEPPALRTLVRPEGPIQRQKYIYYNGRWYAVGHGRAAGARLENPDWEPDEPTNGEMYDDRRGVFTSYRQNVQEVAEKIQRAVKRQNRRICGGAGYRHPQDRYSRMPVEGCTGRNRIFLSTVTGTCRVSIGQGLYKMAGRRRGDPPRYQPRVCAPGGPTNYLAVAGQLGDLSRGLQRRISKTLLRYQTRWEEDYHTPRELLDLPRTQRRALDVLGALTLIEPHFTRAAPDGGKSMRAATRAAGVFGFVPIFGNERAAMLIVREGGNDLVRDTLYWAARRRKLKERMRTAPADRRRILRWELEPVNEELDRARELALLAGSFSESSSDEDDYDDEEEA